MSDRARWTPQYYQKVLATDPIGYWMQDEKQLAVSYDMVTARSNGARNGAYTGVTLGQPGIGDGRTSPLFDGANDYNNIFTASLQGAFNGAEGTVLIWARVSAAGVWTDGSFRHAITFRVDGNNQIYLRKQNANNTLHWYYEAGNVADTVTVGGQTFTDSQLMGMTWSASAGGAGEMRAYVNGVQIGVTQVGLGAWAGLLAVNGATVGANDIVPQLVWDGYLAHAAVWNRPLTPAEVAVLAVA